MVFIVDGIDTISRMGITRRTSRVGKRKPSKRTTRKTKSRATRKTKVRVNASMTRATVMRKLREGKKIRFATRRTRVFKPIMASKWQVEHQEFGIGPLVKGDLSQYGYSSSKKAEERHISINKAVKKYGSTPIFRKLNALYVYNKNRDPIRSNKFKKDRDYVKKMFM
jgi:hypothetical protein